MEDRIESQPVYSGKLFQVFKDRVRLPNGNTTTREIVRHPGSVAIVPRHKDGRYSFASIATSPAANCGRSRPGPWISRVRGLSRERVANWRRRRA